MLTNSTDFNFTIMCRKHILYVLLFPICCMSYWSCQSDTATRTTKKTFANYYVRYDQEAETLRAEASFQEGDSSQNRSPKQFTSVLFGNQAMTLNTAQAQRPFYLATSQGKKAEIARFRFINDQGHQQTDAIELPYISSFSIDSPINLNNPSSLRWDGPPLAKNESLVLLFIDQQNRTTSLILNGPTTASAMALPPQKIRSLQPGKHRFYLVRKTRRPGQPAQMDPMRTVSSVAEFYTKAIDVVVADEGK